MPAKGKAGTARGGTMVKVQSKTRASNSKSISKSVNKSKTLVLSSQSRDDTVTQSHSQSSLEASHISKDKLEEGYASGSIPVTGANKNTKVSDRSRADKRSETGLSETMVSGAELPVTAVIEVESTGSLAQPIGGSETEMSESELLGEERSEIDKDDSINNILRNEISESSLSMNSEDMYKAQFDGTVAHSETLDAEMNDTDMGYAQNDGKLAYAGATEDTEMIEEPGNVNNMPETPTSHFIEPMIEKFNRLGARPKTSSPKYGPQVSPIGNEPKEERSEMVEKLEEMMKIMQDIRDVKTGMNRLDTQIKKMEKIGDDSNNKLTESVKKTVEESMDKLGTNLRQNLNKDMDDKIKEKVVEEVQDAMQTTQANLMVEIEERIETITNQKVTEATNEAVRAVEFENRNYTDKEIGKLDKMVDQKMDEKIEEMVDEKIKKVEKRMELKMKSVQNDVEKKMEKNVEEKINKNLEKNIVEKVENVTNVKLQLAFEDYDEKLWRRKNLLVCNLQESTKKAIDDRKKDDLDRIMPILNKVAKVEESDLESMPVRVGKVGNKPRMLRLSLKSEALVRHVHKKARDNNNIINPTETDNKKKIYVNRDYTEYDREMRKLARKQSKNDRDGNEMDNQTGNNSKYRKLDDRNVNPHQSNFPFPQHQSYGNQTHSMSLDYGRPSHVELNRGYSSFNEDDLHVSTMEVGEMNLVIISNYFIF